MLAPLVAEAVLAVMPKNPINFNVDNVRVVKVMGGGLSDSRVVRGMVFPREPEGTCSPVIQSKKFQAHMKPRCGKIGEEGEGWGFCMPN